MRLWFPVTILTGVAVAAAAFVVPGGSAAVASSTVPAYDHVFVIVEENHGFTDVIGNPAAPNLNAMAQRFGVATAYYGVTHPSEPNYIALLGGDYYGVADDNAYYTHNLAHPSLISQLDRAGITWKAYLQGLPHPDYQGICYPANCNGAPDKDPLYASKHDAIQNFTTSRTLADWNRQVPVTQLDTDIRTGSLPRFGYIVPDECHDEHGDPPYCIDSGNPFDPQDQRLVAVGDAYLGSVVSKLTSASFWARGNNAIAVVYDEGDNNAGCCDAQPGGGRVAAVVITSHGPRGVSDGTPANHYSLLATIQQSFGLSCLAHTCDTSHVKPLARLFAVTGSEAVATHELTPPDYATPTPMPTEPVSSTNTVVSDGGWTVTRAAVLGTADNSLGAVAVASPDNVWAVGNFLPDDANANQDATLALAEHWNGHAWTVAPTPDEGPNFNTLNGVAAVGDLAWAVGVRLDDQYRDRALVETWNGSAWALTSVPQPGSQRDMLFAVSASSADDVWAVGDQEGSGGRFTTLVEHFDGSTWRVVPALNPGASGDHLYGVVALSTDNAWAVGEQLGAGGFDRALVEHWDGESWTVVKSPVTPGATSMLFSVASIQGTIVAAGQTEGAGTGAHPLIEQLESSGATVARLPAVGSTWSELWGISGGADNAWAVGTSVNLTTDNNATIVLRRNSDGSWAVSDAPDPGSGSNILGGVAAVGNTVWAVGTFDDGGNNRPLAECRCPT